MPCPMPKIIALIKNNKLILSDIQIAKIIKLKNIQNKPKLKHFLASTRRANHCDKPEIIKMSVIEKPVIKGPCHGKTSRANDGESDANKLNEAKVQKAVNTIILKGELNCASGFSSLGAMLKGCGMIFLTFIK